MRNQAEDKMEEIYFKKEFDVDEKTELSGSGHRVLEEMEFVDMTEVTNDIPDNNTSRIEFSGSELRIQNPLDNSNCFKTEGLDRTDVNVIEDTQESGLLITNVQGNDEGLWFYCDWCDYRARNKTTLTRHKLINHEEEENVLTTTKQRNFRCVQCDTPFSSRAGLRFHNKTQHGGVKFSCTYCYYETNQKANLIRHIQAKHEGVKYSCDLCGYETSQKYVLSRHHCNPQEEKVTMFVEEEYPESYDKFPCYQCNTLYDTLSALDFHTKTEHFGMRYRCDQCDYVSTKESYLTMHKRAKHTEHLGMNYSCDKCEYVTTKENYLSMHKRAKHEGVIFSCDQCDFTGIMAANLAIHKKAKHPSTFMTSKPKPRGVLTCDQCDYTTIIPQNLSIHKKSKHQGQAVKYRCNQCDYEASHKPTLIRHVRVKHEGVRFTYFRCNQCDYTCDDQYTMACHRNTHIEIQPEVLTS